MHEISNTRNIENVPLTDSVDVSKAELSLKLPPRKHSLEGEVSPRNPIPPSLSEELRSPIFRKNMEMSNQATVHHPQNKKNN